MTVAKALNYIEKLDLCAYSTSHPSICTVWGARIPNLNQIDNILISYFCVCFRIICLNIL